MKKLAQKVQFVHRIGAMILLLTITSCEKMADQASNDQTPITQEDSSIDRVQPIDTIPAPPPQRAPLEDISQEFGRVDEIEKYVLGRTIDEIKASPLTRLYTIKDRVMESEGIEWDAIEFHSNKNKKEIFFAESNWENKQLISRVNLLDDHIKVADGISINSTYQDIRSRVDTSRMNEFPDGYLILYDEAMKNLAYIMDIEDHPEFFYGFSSFDSIPGDLRIESIVINDLK